MFCPECGKQITDDSAFCEYCGARVDDNAGAPQIQSQVRPAEVKPQVQPVAGPRARKSGSGNTVPIILGALIIVAVVGGLLFFIPGIRGDEDSANVTDVSEDIVAEEEIPEPEEPLIVEEEPGKPLVVEEEPEEIFPEAEELPEEEESPVAEEPASLEPVTPVEPEDFDWRDDGLPGTAFSDIEKASGKWKCLIHATATEKAPERFMFTEADVQYHGNVVTIYMDVVSRYELTGDDFNKLETDSGIVVQYDGKWNESTGSIEAASRSSALRFVIDRFSDTGGKQYAVGDSFNGDKPLGEIYLVRP